MKIPSISNRDTWLSVAVFVLLLILYINTLLPGVGFHGDTPKFQFIGRCLGVSHPTGYPAYLMLNHLFVRLFPLGSLAWKANLLSAVLSAAACGVFLNLLRKLEVGPWPALVTALVLGVTRTIWIESLVAEVYTLHLLFMTLSILGFVRWRQTEDDFHLKWAFLVLAISFGNHLMTVLLTPAVAYLLLRTDHRTLVRPKILGWLVLCLFIGTIQYLYPIWRTSVPDTPYVEHAVKNLSELWRYISGAEYRYAMFGLSIQSLLSSQLPSAAHLLWLEFYFLLPITIVGVVRFKDGRVRNFLLIYMLVSFIWATTYTVRDAYVYFIPVHLILGIFTAVGIDDLAGRLRLERNRYLPALMLVIPAVLVSINYNKVEQKGNVRASVEVETLLQMIGQRAVIISPDYHQSQYFLYYLIGEGWGKRDIYVMLHFSPQEIRDYVERRRKIHLPEQRLDVPYGLDIYCYSEDQAAELAKVGLQLKRVAGNVLKVM